MGRAPCCSKVGLHRGPWTPKEDFLLTKYIEAHGEGQWRSLPKKAGLLRCGKSCRLRWMNYLRPDIKRGNITPDEDDLIIRLHALLGNRWSLIAGRLPGRTDNEIKNYWNTHLSKKLRSQGTDPDTHKKLDPDRANRPKPTKKKRTASNSKKHKGKALNHGNAGDVEKPKIHLPRPVRVTSLSLTRNDSNASFESNLTSVSTSPCNVAAMTDGGIVTAALWQSYQDGMMMMVDENVGDDDRDGVRFLIGCDKDDVVGLGVQEQGFTDHPRASDQNMLDKLYEEYLQLIKADDDHDLDNLDGDQAQELDSFAKSLFI